MTPGWRGRAWLAGCVFAWLHGGAVAQADAAPLVQRLAPGVYRVAGSVDSPSAANRGALGNSGFIATPAGTVVVNTGGSYRLGRELLALAERRTGRPVIAAVITQARPEFLMGAAAFVDRGIEVVAHAAAARLIAQRCQFCLRRLQEQVGDEAMAGTRPVAPTREIVASERIAPGGRRIDLMHLGPAQTEGDIVVIDVDSGVAFAGALVTDQRLPELDTVGHAAPWRMVLAALAARPLSTLVPGYGSPGRPQALIAATDGYLAQLEGEVQARLDAGDDLQQAARAVRLPAWRRWAQYDALHARNVQLQYLAAEAAWLAQPPPAGSADAGPRSH